MQHPSEDPAKAGPKSAGIRSAVRSVAISFLLAGALYWMSVAALFAFRIGGRLTHSVAAARAFDAVGALFLLPGRLVLWRVPAYMLFFPSVIVPVNTGAWLVLLCAALILRGRFSGDAR